MHSGGHAWQGCVWQGVCMAGGMCGRGAYMAGGHAWWRGHVWQGACMVGGMHSSGRGACVAGGVCMMLGHVWQILRDMVNERAVRILLECIPAKYEF